MAKNSISTRDGTDVNVAYANLLKICIRLREMRETEIF